MCIRDRHYLFALDEASPLWLSRLANILFFLIMEFLPYLVCRHFIFFGGAWFRNIILRRLLLNCILIAAAISQLPSDATFEGVTIGILYSSALGLTFVGIASTLYFATSTHRWTLHKNKETCEEGHEVLWRGALDETALTLDDQRMHILILGHPSKLFFIKDEVRDWILSLTIRNPLFAGSVFSDSVLEVAGHGFTVTLEKLKRRYAWMAKGNDESVRQVTEHLDRLIQDLEEKTKPE